MPKQEQATGANGATTQHSALSTQHSGTVDFRDKVDILDYQRAAGSGRRQPLAGFEETYTDIVDYIVRCTHRMWEEGGIGLLYDHYTENATVWSDWGVSYGRERTIEYVIQRLAAFPDYRLYPDDVIWAGDEEAGFRTSHRLMQIGHNTGWSKYGPPTGRRVQYRAIANCVARANMIYEEWLIHDELAAVRQLGLDVDAVLRTLDAQVDRTMIADALISESPRVVGQLTPARYEPKHPDGWDVEDFVRQGVQEVWNWRLLNKLPQYYARTCPVHAPSHRELYGLGDIKAWILTLLAAFPDGQMEIDDLYWNGNARDGWRTAVRWTFTGTHRGVGPYGPPTGKHVRILGTTQHRIVDGLIAEEWTLFNELALLWKLRYA